LDRRTGTQGLAPARRQLGPAAGAECHVRRAIRQIAVDLQHSLRRVAVGSGTHDHDAAVRLQREVRQRARVGDADLGVDRAAAAEGAIPAAVAVQPREPSWTVGGVGAGPSLRHDHAPVRPRDQGDHAGRVRSELHHAVAAERAVGASIGEVGADPAVATGSVGHARNDDPAFSRHGKGLDLRIAEGRDPGVERAGTLRSDGRAGQCEHRGSREHRADGPGQRPLAS